MRYRARGGRGGGAMRGLRGPALLFWKKVAKNFWVGVDGWAQILYVALWAGRVRMQGINFSLMVRLMGLNHWGVG